VIPIRSWRRAGVILAGASLALTSLGGGALAQDDAAEPATGTAECAVGTSELGIPPGAAEVELFHQMTPLEGSETVDTSGFAAEGPYVIGFSDWGLVNSHRVQTRGAMEILARELGVTLQITDAGGDTSKQIADVDDLLTRGIDALVIAPAVADALGPAIERASDAGIPVVVFQSSPGTDRYTSFVYADDAQFGQAGMEKLAEDMGGEGSVIALRGVAGNPVETARYDGFRSVADQYPDITVVGEDYGDWNEDKGKAITQNLLAANPQIDGVWSSGAAMTKGAIAAFQEAGRELPPMSGEHLNGFLKLWQELGIRSVAPVYPSWMGPEALKLTVLALEGQCIYKDYLVLPEPITNEDLADAVEPDVSDDYWVEGYLNDEQILEVFPQ
jgi:ribose transport system substrate-binding protein